MKKLKYKVDKLIKPINYPIINYIKIYDAVNDITTFYVVCNAVKVEFFKIRGNKGIL